MPLYMVRMADEGGGTKIGGYNTALVSADNATIAKSVAAARFANGGDVAAQWTAAVATELASPASLMGVTWRVLVQDPADDSVVADVSHTSLTTEDVDDAGAALVILLNATASIANSSYASNVLTISSIADAIGDMRVSVFCNAETVRHPEAIAVAGVWSTIVDEGIAGAVLQATMTMVIQPHVWAMVKADEVPVASTAT